MSLWHIAVLIPLLNSSTNDLLSYSLPLAALLNSYTNSSIVFPPYSSLFNSIIFTDSLSPSLNSFLISAKNSPTISYSSNPSSKSSNIFSFYTSADSSYIYERIYCICSSTTTSLIFILIYNLHAIMKPKTCDKVLSNTCGFATSMLITPVTPSTTPLFVNA